MQIFCGTHGLYINDLGPAGVVCEAPDDSWRMMQSTPERGEGFDVVTHPEPEGDSQTMSNHYSHYNSQIPYIFTQILMKNRIAAILLTEIHRALSPICT